MLSRKSAADRCLRVALPLLLLYLCGCDEIMPRRSPGEKLYRKHCSTCHGVAGNGQTVRSMGDPNADLLDDMWRHPSDPAGLASVLRQGLVFEHPTYDKLSNEEIKQIVDHLLSLRGERR